MNISSSYTDPNRSFMEFVDNSIDAAEKGNILMHTLNGEAIEYAHSVDIKISITGKTFRDGKVKISDNCSGIKELRKVVERIGNSEKKSQSWTNGQFGYGIYSFMAVCQTMEIRTKHSDNLYSEYIKISKDDFMIDDLNDLKFDITQESPHTTGTGTEVILSGFSKDSWNDIDTDLLKSEIEDHFELLLRDPSIKIRIRNSNGTSSLCVPYDYNKHQGEIFEKSITIPIKGNKYDDLFKKNEIKIFLKITPGVSVERPPVLISKNRRVLELRQIKLLKTFNKLKIYSRPIVTGYVDTKDLLTPTLARNDFKNDKNFKLVRKAILDAEDEILAKFKEVIASSTTRDFSELESDFNSNLESLIDLTSDEKMNIKPGDVVTISESGEKILSVLVRDVDGSNESGFPTGSNSSGGKKSKKKNTPSELDDIISMDHSREFVIPPRSNERSLIMKIDDTSDPIKDNDGKEKRSELFGNTVNIYKKHPDFMKRISKNTLEIEIINSELITYLASEMLIHYTNYNFEQNKKDKQSDSKEVLMFFTDWLYRLEDSLKKLIGKPLSK
ncbi:MAG: ATP-binding protein [Ignavibacteriae bacterium]|nr:ATP-binding protein [Ignavibacteriota bacterium]